MPLFGVQRPSYWMLAVVGRWETGPLPFLGCAAADIISVDVENAFRFLWVKKRAFGIYGPVVFVMLHLCRNAGTEAEVVTSQQRWTLTGRPNLKLWLGLKKTSDSPHWPGIQTHLMPLTPFYCFWWYSFFFWWFLLHRAVRAPLQVHYRIIWVKRVMNLISESMTPFSHSFVLKVRRLTALQWAVEQKLPLFFL